MNYIKIVIVEIFNFIQNENVIFNHKLEILISISIITSIFFFILSWGVYEKSDKYNFGNFKKFNFETFLKQILLGLILTISLFYIGLINFNIQSIVITTIFWKPLFRKVMNVLEKSSKDLLNSYERE